MKKSVTARPSRTIRYIDDMTAQVTKEFQKKAMIFGTEEFKLWREYKAEFPSAAMTTKTIKKNPDKKTYKNLTYKNIKLFLAEQENGEALLAEFEKQKKLSVIQESPYRSVLAWFLEKFPNYDSYKDFFDNLKEAEEEATNVTSISELPKVVNQ